MSVVSVEYTYNVKLSWDTRVTDYGNYREYNIHDTEGNPIYVGKDLVNLGQVADYLRHRNTLTGSLDTVVYIPKMTNSRFDKIMGVLDHYGYDVKYLTNGKYLIEPHSMMVTSLDEEHYRYSVIETIDEDWIMLEAENILGLNKKEDTEMSKELKLVKDIKHTGRIVLKSKQVKVIGITALAIGVAYGYKKALHPHVAPVVKSFKDETVRQLKDISSKLMAHIVEDQGAIDNQED